MKQAGKSPRSGPPRPIGLFGGTFDPPHRGHIFAATLAMRRLGLEKVVFIPSGHPPHKPEGGISPANMRLAMTRLAIRNHPGLEASPVEIRRRGTSYTIYTARAMSRRFPGRELYFIVGADTARDLTTWKSWRELMRLVRFAVIARPGCRMKAVPGFRGRFELLNAGGIPLASNRLRKALAGGRIPSGSIPTAVARYIRAHGLYLKRKV